jgi:hypothetical protein
LTFGKQLVKRRFDEDIVESSNSELVNGIEEPALFLIQKPLEIALSGGGAFKLRLKSHLYGPQFHRGHLAYPEVLLR